ncbi:MAG: hypothetical protein ACOCUV_01505 [bacterium]
MRKLFTILVAVSLTVSVLAQAPGKMSYQAVVRNSSNTLITNQQVGMQISILQISASGTAVYVERQTPTSNDNGLVSIEIGDGTVLSGDFTAIDWANGPYYIKTETDPTGGTSYTITGTSQLLSVPYALHAKTVETVTETDPYYSNSQAANITATDINNLGNLSGVNTGDQDISGIATNEQAIKDSAAQIRSDMPDASGVINLSVGDFALGGIVFWVDETGQHGLVAAKQDQSNDMRWCAGSYGFTQAKGDGPYAGEANTAIIIASQVAIGDDGYTYAARICNELQVTEGGKTYGDWYLPSKEELNIMYQNKEIIDSTATVNGGANFADDYYWSSTEDYSSLAWRQFFSGGGWQDAANRDGELSVRAIRSF